MLVAFILALVHCAAPCAAYTLMYSTSRFRSNPKPLDAATLSKSDGGNLYVFTSPNTDVKYVRFNLDGLVTGTENNAPFDLFGGTVEEAKPAAVSLLSLGTHYVGAQLAFNTIGKSDKQINARFTVISGTSTIPPTPPPTPPPTRGVTCTDGVQNGDETGKDCGGSRCLPCGQPRWVVGDWSECDKPCGGGNQTRTVRCVDTAGNDVPHDLCLKASGHEGVDTQKCNVQLCDTYEWAVGLPGDCSRGCGPGKATRKVECRATNTASIVADALCRASTKPDPTSDCNLGDCVEGQFTWSTSAWGPCSAKCDETSQGRGTQSRTVTCVNSAGELAISDSCKTTPPVEQGACEINCASYSWFACPWQKCTSTCGGANSYMAGSRVRDVFCVDQWLGTVDPSLCEGQPPVKLEEGCNPQPCTANFWMTTSWSACSAQTKFEVGTRTRTSHCHTKEGANAQDEDCPQALAPKLSMECRRDICDAEEKELREISASPPSLSPPSSLVLAAVWGAVAMFGFVWS